MAKRTNYKKPTRGRTSSRARSEAKDFDEKKSKSYGNDPSWYTVSGQITKDVASFSFNNPTGIQYRLDDGAYGSFVDPGVMSIFMVPTPGYSEGLSSPINVAAKNLYSFIRHENSGKSNYDSPDLILYLLAMASAYGYYSWLTRIYGMIRVYSQHNRYLGANLVECCGVDSSSILSNLANFRAYVNQYALKLSALSVPTVMSIFKRYIMLFGSIYADEGTDKCQLYMYNPGYFYRYDEYNGAGRLVAEPLCLNASGGNRGTPITYSDIITYGDNLIASLIGSEDIGIMSGDIIKAYGKENCWKLMLIDESFAVAPTFDEEVLMQIHNSNFVGSRALKDTALTAGWDSFFVEQDTNIGNGCLVCKPLVGTGGNIQGNQILDSWKGALDPDWAIVASRNIVSGTRWSQGFTAVTAFGSEIPMWAKIFKLNPNGTLASGNYYNNDDRTQFNTTNPTGVDAVNYLSELSYFNQHPRLQLVDYTSTTPYIERSGNLLIGEMSDFTVISPEDIEKMHLSAILSELAVPYLGNLVK